jgi:hypothetical protein
MRSAIQTAGRDRLELNSVIEKIWLSRRSLKINQHASSVTFRNCQDLRHKDNKDAIFAIHAWRSCLEVTGYDFIEQSEFHPGA